MSEPTEQPQPSDPSGSEPIGEHEVPFPDLDLGIEARGGAAFAELHLLQRRLQDLLTGATLPSDLSAEVARTLREVADVAERHQAAESERYDGFRWDLPGRGHPFLPPYRYTDTGTEHVEGTVTFGRFHLGGHAAVHGGAIPVLFDDVLGWLVNHGRAGIARTAYLTTNYRRVTPLDVELSFRGTLDRTDGRKRFASIRLFGPAGDLLADAEALFVDLRPGQP